MAVTLRYFAAARAASGVDEESTAPGTVEQVLGAAVDAHGPDLEKVLGRCSYLLDGVAVTDLTVQAPDGATLDVLPPFAGG